VIGTIAVAFEIALLTISVIKIILLPVQNQHISVPLSVDGGLCPLITCVPLVVDNTGGSLCYGVAIFAVKRYFNFPFTVRHIEFT